MKLIKRFKFKYSIYKLRCDYRKTAIQLKNDLQEIKQYKTKIKEFIDLKNKELKEIDEKINYHNKSNDLESIDNFVSEQSKLNDDIERLKLNTSNVTEMEYKILSRCLIIVRLNNDVSDFRNGTIDKFTHIQIQEQLKNLDSYYLDINKDYIYEQIDFIIKNKPSLLF